MLELRYCSSRRGRRTTMLYAYFGGLGADKQSTYELLLEQRGVRYIVSAITIPRRLAQGTITRHARRWLCPASGAPTTRQLYNGQDGRIALRALFRAARAANLAEHGQ